MKNIYQLLALITLLVSGCSQDEVIKGQSSSSNSLIYTASFEGSESRTYLNEDGYLRWTADDQISIFGANTYNQQYKFTGETGANSGTFEKVTVSYPTGTDLNHHYALYPYSSQTTISETGVITATIPANQTYAVNSFGLGDNTMVAVTKDEDDTFLKFKNVGGYLELKLYGDDVTVKSIKLEGNSDEKLAGNATITSTYGQEPTISMANDATKNITMNCGETGVQLGTTAETATTFLLVVPPTTFASGFTITVTDINGGEFTKSTSKSIEIKRNIIQPMNAFEVDVTPYLTFKAKEAQSLKLSMPVKTLQFSVNGNNWIDLEDKTIDFGGVLGDLRIRGKSLIGTATKPDDLKYFIFGNSTEVSCLGDIRTLVDYENYKTTSMSKAKFIALFSYCTCLITAPQLPATELAEECYFGMFIGCTKLKVAPALPAIKLANYCYESMFSKCSSLTEAPTLPATELASACYRNMFSNCSSLTTPPELPATKLTWNCYYRMFEGCTSLKTAPRLSATELAWECYYGMFLNCSNLIDAPALPAKTLVGDYCYYRMFEGCTSLKVAPALPATTMTLGCYDSMFKDCHSLITAPELPATTLAEYCYRSMFQNCKSLIKSPILPATTLAEYCYQSMFAGCSAMNEITMLAPNLYPKNSFYAWVSGVASVGVFIKSNDLKSLTIGNSGVPSGWIVNNYNE